MKLEKYKNKDGIELSFNSMSEDGREGSGAVLIQEIISEAINILNVYDSSSTMSMNMAIQNTKKFLKANFDIG